MDRPIYGIGRKARPALRTSALEVADYVAPADAAVPAPVPAPPPPEVGADVEKAAVDPEIERVRRRLGRLYDIIGGLVDAYATLHRATRYTLERGEELDGALAELRTYFKGLKRTLKEEIRECIDYLEANGAPEEEDAREE
jgi:hypothetical protein